MIKAKPKKVSSKTTLAQLATEMGVSISTVWRWQNAGIPAKGGPKGWREKHLKQALKKLGSEQRSAA